MDLVGLVAAAAGLELEQYLVAVSAFVMGSILVPVEVADMPEEVDHPAALQALVAVVDQELVAAVQA